MKMQPKMVIPVIVITSVSFVIYWVGRSDTKTVKRRERYHRWTDAHADREMDIAGGWERGRRRLSLPNLQRRRAFDSMMVTDPATGLAVITATMAADPMLYAADPMLFPGNWANAPPA